MRVRIKYSKQGLMKFIGHLDMMRSFQKLLRRTAIDVTFSEGYSPHMVMSYAFPLGVGMTSDSEYVDVDLNRSYQSEWLVAALNREAPDGIHFLDAAEVPVGKANKGMTLVARADYTLLFREGHAWPGSWKDDFREWIRRPEIMAVRKGKKTEKVINIAPLIYRADVDPKPHTVRGIADSLPAVPAADRNRGAGLRTGDLFLALSAGSAANIRPELVMDTFAAACGYPADPYRFRINRDEVYADTGEGEAHQFIPLIELGTRIGET